jgi:protoporphyrinogen oxidase
MSRVLILGAGPAGMAAAMTLHRAGRRFTLVERAAQVGGLAKTYQFGEFRTDHGPHRFFSKNRFLYDFIEGLIGEHWIPVDRFTRFYIGGRFFKYPIELKETLSKLGWRKAARAVYNYFVLQKLRPFKAPPRDFEEYALSQFGRTLAEFNILKYTEKIWGLPCRELSWEWGAQRIQGLSAASLLKKTLLNRGGGP